MLYTSNYLCANIFFALVTMASEKDMDAGGDSVESKNFEEFGQMDNFDLIGNFDFGFEFDFKSDFSVEETKLIDDLQQVDFSQAPIEIDQYVHQGNGYFQSFFDEYNDINLSDYDQQATDDLSMLRQQLNIGEAIELDGEYGVVETKEPFGDPSICQTNFDWTSLVNSASTNPSTEEYTEAKPFPSEIYEAHNDVIPNDSTFHELQTLNIQKLHDDLMDKFQLENFMQIDENIDKSALKSIENQLNEQTDMNYGRAEFANPRVILMPFDVNQNDDVTYFGDKIRQNPHLLRSLIQHSSQGFTTNNNKTRIVFPLKPKHRKVPSTRYEPVDVQLAKLNDPKFVLPIAKSDKPKIRERKQKLKLLDEPSLLIAFSDIENVDLSMLRPAKKGNRKHPKGKKSPAKIQTGTKNGNADIQFDNLRRSLRIVTKKSLS